MYQTNMATSQIISNRLTKWSQKQEKILKNQFGIQIVECMGRVVVCAVSVDGMRNIIE